MGIYINAFAALPEFETERLIIRRIEKTDVDDIYEYSSDTSVTKWLLWSAHTSRKYTKKFIEAVIQGYGNMTYFEYALVLKENGKLIGTCGFSAVDEHNRSAELGYVVSDKYRGNGYALEASIAFIRIAFDYLHLERVCARYMVENVASKRVMEKLGMRYEGTHINEIYVKEEFRSVGYYALLKEEYDLNKEFYHAREFYEVRKKRGLFGLL